MPNQLPDYHMHTRLCNHAEGEMEAYIEQAIAAGLTEMGFSDHMPVMPEPHLCMRFDQLPYYVEKVLNLQERYQDQISIKLGCEMDIVLGRIDEIHSIIERYPFDYVIGSIHYLDEWPFDQKEYSGVFNKGNIDKIYGGFFDAIIEAIHTGVHDIIGHIDNIKRMGHRPAHDLHNEYERVAKAVKEAGMVVEINTSGYDHDSHEPYPSPDFLAILRSHGVPVTCGSDAHLPSDVGRHFDKARQLLDNTGYDLVTLFHQRRRSFQMISDVSSSQSEPIE